MELLLGLDADGRTYPDYPGAGAGALDRAIVGPAGLVDVLEIQLGLTGPSVPKAVRIAAFMAKLGAATGQRFWSKSFGKDPWSTATLLLGWRDGLVSGGWDGAPIGQPRTDDLAAAELAGRPLPAGLADRVSTLTRAVPSRPGLRLTRLTLLERRDQQPPGVSMLVEALERTGVAIEQARSDVAPQTDSDLARAHRLLDGEAPEVLAGDGTLVLLEADTTLMAAEVVADWLANASPEDREGTVILAPDGDTALLDHALSVRGVPVLGLSKHARSRAALQVLPLAFAVAWAPFDPTALRDLLLLPRPPIPRFAARRLARALQEAPGLNSPGWRRAWDEIEASARERQPEGGASIEEGLAKWREWMCGGQSRRPDGMPLTDALAIAGRVEAWARAQDGGQGDALLLALAGAAKTFADAVKSLGTDQLPALLVERVLAQVLADGAPNPGHVAEAGMLRAVRSPGAICGPVRNLVWWAFAGPGEHPPLQPWSDAEAAAWEAAGVRLEPTHVAARRISEAYGNALRHVTERALLVRPAMSGSEPTTAHPLAHQLRPLTEGPGTRVRWRAEQLLESSDACLAGRPWTRTAIEVLDPPLAVAEWAAPGTVTARLAERRESPTSLGSLLACQARWLAQDVLGLRRGRHAEPLNLDQLIGNLAHAVANELLRPGPPPALEGFLARATVVLDDLAPQLAAPLLLPAFAAELAAARKRVPEGLEALARALHEARLEVVGTELDREGVVAGLPLRGRLDLLVRGEAGVGVIDLKWTRSVRRYRDEVADGLALQLAVYGGIADPHDEAATGGYFLLRQGRLLAPRGSFLPGEDIAAAQTLAQTLHLVVEDAKAWRQLAQEGVAIAAGVEGAADLRPEHLYLGAAEEPCRFCDLKGLCRIDVEAV